MKKLLGNLFLLTVMSVFAPYVFSQEKTLADEETTTSTQQIRERLRSNIKKELPNTDAPLVIPKDGISTMEMRQRSYEIIEQDGRRKLIVHRLSPK